MISPEASAANTRGVIPNAQFLIPIIDRNVENRSIVPPLHHGKLLIVVFYTRTRCDIIRIISQNPVRQRESKTI